MAATLYTTRSGATAHPEEMLNQLLNLMVYASGIVDPVNNHLLVEEADSPDMSVDVRQGYAYLKNAAGSMVYPVRLADEDANVAITSNGSGNGRIDAVVLYIDLGASPNAAGTNVAKLIVVAGTPAGSPAAPTDGEIETAIGASNPYVRLANVTVDSGETTILDADVSDQRAAVELQMPGGLILGSGMNIKDGAGVKPTFALFVPAAAGHPVEAAPAGDAETVEFATNDINVKGVPFDATTEEKLAIHYLMPANYDGGTIKFRPVWYATGRASGDGVIWALSGRSFVDNTAIDQALGTEVELEDNWTADDRWMIGALSDAVTLAGSPAGGQMAYLQIARKTGNAADDLNVDAVLAGFILEYQANAYSQ